MEELYRDFTVCENCGKSCYLGNKYCEDCANELWEVECAFCAEKNNQITDLEAKLAESEKEIKEWIAVRDDKNNVINKQTEKINQLKQQLAEKDKTIENLRLDLKDYQDLEEKISTKYDKVVEKLAQADQDKISFTVEQLEKVKELLLDNLYDLYSKPSEIWDKYGDLYDVVVEGGINKTIDNQIKQLKETE